MVRRDGAVASFAIYGVAMILLKGFSLITIPLVARHLSPAAFGDLDIAVSLGEFMGLIASLGLAETLYRFAPDAGPAETSEIVGTAIIGAILLALVGQIMAPWLHTVFDLKLPLLGLQALFAAAAVTGLIEMPLAWIRLRNRPLAFLGFVACRSLLQIGLLWVLLIEGFGPEGILFATFWTHTGFGAIMLVLMIRHCGVTFRWFALQRLAIYGLPLVGSGLALFALGSLDRWFLASHVSREEIAHYAIAVKFALAAALVIQPFGLWWNPRRLGILAGSGGKAKNADAWKVGFVIMATGGAMVCLTMPFFVHIALPQSYFPALNYLPFLVISVILNELVTLSNAGAYLGRSSTLILKINLVAACLAILGYSVAVPILGVGGAILATILAHGFRLFAFVVLTRHTAPVPIFDPGVALVGLTALTPVIAIHSNINPLVQNLIVLVTPILIGLAGLMSGMIKLPKAVPVVAHR